ncbi:MAG: hypothetical protein KR126chlam6_00742, partial [Candidatus Anoxychlamydiales bacterium]|nr:hypothetical protein [Candidatus Anoxychlamydiales bacterium]
LESDGVMFDIVPGEKLSLKDLLHGAIVISGCDASNVAAESLEGSIETFMQSLNLYIKKRGIVDTHLTNPHGLHMPEHVSTAIDIAKMTKLAIKNPNFLKIFSCKFFIRPQTNKQNKKEIITNNKLMKPGEYYYKNVIGSKTGYHAKAKYNLVSVAKKDNRTLIAVVLGCSTTDVRFEDTIKLFNLAFSEKKQTKVLIEKEKLFFSKINGAAKIVKASLKYDLDIDYYLSEEMDLKAIVVYDDLKAPIKMGQKVATIEIKNKDNEIIQKANLYAKQSVRRVFFRFLKELFVKS